MNRFFTDSKTIQRYRSGPLGEHIQKLADLFAESGFRRLPGRMQLRAPPVPEEPKPHDLLLGQFADYLERERGLSAATILHRRGILLRFIRHCYGTGPMDWQKIEAGDVVRFIHKQAAAARTTLGAKNITTATRSFLHYARCVGLIEKDLAGAVPAVASWSLANVPRVWHKDHLTCFVRM